MTERRMDGYSSTQIMLHWSIAILVAFQFFLNDGIAEAFRAAVRGEEADADALGAASVHVTIGLVILTLAFWRIALRLTFGAPPPPPGEGPVLRLLARGTHLLLYVLIVIVPMSGAAAWFGGIEQAGIAHSVLKSLLFVVVMLHIAGALVQHFVFRSDVLTRMLMTRE